MNNNQNNVNKTSDNIDVSALVYTNIEYDINEEDLDNQDEYETIEEMHDSLPKVVKVNIDQEDRCLVLEAINDKELGSLSEVWDWFSDETGWCVCDATVTTIDGRYSE